MKKSLSLIKLLVVTNVILIAFVCFLLLTGFSSRDKTGQFTEINAERINIIGENGKPVLVLTNKNRIPGPSANGRDYPRDIIDGRKYFSGLLFFNEQGDEVGGLIYGGIKKDSVTYSQVVHLSFDQWKQNQVVGLDYNDNSKSRYAGLRVWDRPVNVPISKQFELLGQLVKNKNNAQKADSIRKILTEAENNGDNGVERMFIGSRNEVAQVQIKDKKGKVRVKLYVDNKTDQAKLEFYNDKGEVTNTFPN